MLVIGGDGARASTEVWAHGRFRPGPPLLHGRQGHTATLLKDGRVLVVGGYDAEGRAIGATELLGVRPLLGRPNRGLTPVRAP